MILKKDGKKVVKEKKIMLGKGRKRSRSKRERRTKYKSNKERMSPISAIVLNYTCAGSSQE
jgi:hypothetical protein